MTIVINEKIVKFLLWSLGIILSITSAYLFKKYHIDIALGHANGFCDINAVFNCEVVNLSPYSKILSIPVSLLGVVYGLGYLLLLLKKQVFSEKLWQMYYYNLLGLLFVFYFVWAEWKLGAICLLCTIVHICIVLSLWLCSVFINKPIGKYIKKIKHSFLLKLLVIQFIISIILYFYFSWS